MWQKSVGHLAIKVIMIAVLWNINMWKKKRNRYIWIHLEKNKWNNTVKKKKMAIAKTTYGVTVASMD